MKPVLVVDDSSETRESIRSLIADAALPVVLAADGRAALGMMLDPKHPVDPSMLVVDLSMPEMSGWEFIAIVNSYVGLAPIPIIVVTGTGYRADALRHHAVAAFFAKPIDAKKFIATVKELAAR
jgi:CheY-like chemotaxis protein